MKVVRCKSLITCIGLVGKQSKATTCAILVAAAAALGQRPLAAAPDRWPPIISADGSATEVRLLAAARDPLGLFVVPRTCWAGAWEIIGPLEGRMTTHEGATSGREQVEEINKSDGRQLSTG